MSLGRTIAELYDTMGASEYSKWVQFYQEEPWGSYRDNLHAGIIASAIVNMAGKSSRKTLSANDFILLPDVDKKRDETCKNILFLRAIAKRK